MATVQPVIIIRSFTCDVLSSQSTALVAKILDSIALPTGEKERSECNLRIKRFVHKLNMYAIVLIIPSPGSPLRQCLSASILSHSGDATQGSFPTLDLAKHVPTSPTSLCLPCFLQLHLGLHPQLLQVFAQGSFCQRSSLTALFKLKIFPSSAPCLPLPLLALFLFSALLILGVPLPLSPPLFCAPRGCPPWIIPTGLFCSLGFQFELGHGRPHSRGLEGERSEKLGCFFPQ